MRTNLFLSMVVTMALVGCGDDGGGDDGSTTLMTSTMTMTMPTTPMTETGDVPTTGTPGTEETGGTDTGEPETTAPTGLSFATDVYGPIISGSCSCHLGGASGGLAMGGDAATAYAALVGMPSSSGLAYVEAGSSQMSYMWHKVNGTQASVGGGGSQMPQVGGPLAADQIATIAQWIDEGALP